MEQRKSGNGLLVQVHWKSLVVLYEHEEGLLGLQELLKVPQVRE